MSTYQIRTHYIFYSVIKSLFDGDDFNFALDTDRAKMTTYIPYQIYVRAMDFSETEMKDFGGRLAHSVWGILSENLISNHFAYGSVEAIIRFYKQATEPGIIFRPSAPGLELFLWAHGRPDVGPHEFLNPNVRVEVDKEITFGLGSAKVTE